MGRVKQKRVDELESQLDPENFNLEYDESGEREELSRIQNEYQTDPCNE